MSWELQQAQQRADSEIYALLQVAGAPRNINNATGDPLLGPGARLADIIRADKCSPVLSPKIVSVLRAGAIKRLRRIVQDVSELGPLCTRLDGPNNLMIKDQPSLFWIFAITALSALYDRLSVAAQANSWQAEVKQAWVDCRATAERTIISFKNYNFLEGQLETKPEEEQTLYRVFMVGSINAVSPLFDERFSEIEVKIFKESQAEFIRIVLQARAFLIAGPLKVIGVDVAKAILQCSAILTTCFGTYAIQTRRESPLLYILRTPIDASWVTGLSYESLIQTILSPSPQILTQPSATQLQSRLAQFEVVIALVRDYKTIHFVKAFANLGCFAYAVVLFKDLRASPDHFIKQNTEHVRYDLACYNLIVSTWRDMLDDIPDKDLAIITSTKVVDVSILFLVEWWSFHALDERLDELSDIASFLLKMLRASSDTSVLEKYVQQLRTISQRMSSRPDVRPRLAELWKKTYLDLGQSKTLAPPVTEESDVCNMVGCESVQPAESRCARCGKALYCSKTCQLSDWKAHKQHCVSKKRT